MNRIIFLHSVISTLRRFAISVLLVAIAFISFNAEGAVRYHDTSEQSLIDQLVIETKTLIIQPLLAKQDDNRIVAGAQCLGFFTGYTPQSSLAAMALTMENQETSLRVQRIADRIATKGETEALNIRSAVQTCYQAWTGSS